MREILFEFYWREQENASEETILCTYDFARRSVVNQAGKTIAKSRFARREIGMSNPEEYIRLYQEEVRELNKIIKDEIQKILSPLFPYNLVFIEREKQLSNLNPSLAEKIDRMHLFLQQVYKMSGTPPLALDERKAIYRFIIETIPGLRKTLPSSMKADISLQLSAMFDLVYEKFGVEEGDLLNNVKGVADEELKELIKQSKDLFNEGFAEIVVQGLAKV